MIKNIFVTGKPRVGKTTLIKKLVENLDSAGGFYTQEIIRHNMRQGFKIITLDGQEGILARKGLESPYRLGKYGILIDDLEEIGVRALEEALQEKEIIVIDEVGKMELFSTRFRQAVLKALDSPKRVISVIQMANLPFLNQIRNRPDVKIYTLTYQNRDMLLKTLKQCLNQDLQD